MNWSLILVVAVISGAIAAAIGPYRGWDARTAFFIALFLGPLGILVVLVVKGSVPTPAEMAERRRMEELQEWQQEHGGHAFSSGPLPPEGRHQ